MEDKRNKDIPVSRLTEMIDDALDNSTAKDARRQSEKARDYYDGNQLTAHEIETLKKRRQPIVVNNKIQTTVDFLKGMELRGRTDPKAWPRTPEEEADAFVATDALRYVQDNTNFNSIASDVYENFLIEGPGGCSVEVKKGKNGPEIAIHYIPYDRLIFDPYSRNKQMTDCRFTGVVLWMDLAAAKERWPDKVQSLDEAWASHAVNWQARRDEETYGDKPRWYQNTGRKRLMVIEMYFIEAGKWHRAVFCHDIYLEEPKVSPYKDEFGEPESPHIFACPKISREGAHYGPIQTKLSMQDDINKRRSKATDLMTRRQTFSKQGMLDDVDEFKRQANDSGGHLEWPATGKFGEDFGFIENINLGQAQFQMYKDALTDLEALSHASLAPKNETNLSGRALRELSSGRSTEIQPTIEVYTQWRIRVFRAVWNRIKQYWKEERWIRVTDDEDAARFVGVNRNMTVKDALIQEYGSVPAELQDDPRLDEEVKGPDGKPIKMNKIAEMDVDIWIDEVADTVNMQAEQFELLLELAKVRPDEVDFEDIVELSQLRNKDKYLKRGKMTPEQQQAQQAKQQAREQAMQLEMAEKQSRVQANQAKAQDMIQRATQTAIENEILRNSPIAPTSLSL